MKFFISIFFLFLFTASTVLAVELDPDLLQTMEACNFNPEQIRTVQSAINTAAQQGIPTAVLSRKVYEGVAKRVNPERIVQALARVSSRYQTAYGLARKLGNQQEVITTLGNTIATGMAAGLNRKDAEKLVDVLASRSSQMKRGEFARLAEETLAVARDMGRRGVSSKATSEVVSRAVQKGFSAEDMESMRKSFGKRSSNVNSETLAMEYGKAIDQGARGQDLEGTGSGERGSGSSGSGSASSAGGNSGEGGSNSGGSDGGGGGSGGHF